MAALNRAYGVLGDPLARSVYDRDRRLAANPYVSIGGAPRPGYARGAAPPSPDEAPLPRAAFGNPNGAGEFFAMLCLLLALCFLAWTQRNGAEHALITILVVAGALGLLALALLLFTDDSPLARLALRWAEGEPRGMAPGTHTHAATREPPRAPRAPTGNPADLEAELEAAAVARFERLVDEALATVPAEFAPYLANVVVRIEEEPSAETLRQAGVGHGHTLLGLYHGVPLTQQGGAGAGPGVISIYRQPIEHVSRNRPTRIRAQVRATVLHELAHHFGIDHDEMPAWVK